MPKRNEKEEKAYVNKLCKLADAHVKTISERLNDLERHAFSKDVGIRDLLRVASAVEASMPDIEHGIDQAFNRIDALELRIDLHRQSLANHRTVIEGIWRKMNAKKWWQIWK